MQKKSFTSIMQTFNESIDLSNTLLKVVNQLAEYFNAPMVGTWLVGIDKIFIAKVAQFLSDFSTQSPLNQRYSLLEINSGTGLVVETF